MHWNLNLGIIIRFKTGLGLLDAIGGGNGVDAHMRFDPRLLLLLFLMVLVWYILQLSGGLKYIIYNYNTNNARRPSKRAFQ
jgi:hypothetical protein